MSYGQPQSSGKAKARGASGRLFTRVTRSLVRGRWLSVLRRWGPIARVGRIWVVTRHADVCEVLDRHADFEAPYGRKLEALIGPVLIGIDDVASHRRTRQALDRADRRDEPETRRAELERLQGQATDVATQLLDAADGGLDVVAGLIEPVVHAGIADYLGIRAPDAATLGRWSRAIGRDVFLNPRDDPKVVRGAQDAAEELIALVAAHIGERRSRLEGDLGPRTGAGTLLDRLLADSGQDPDGLDEQAVRDNVVGLIVLWAVAVPRATALAFDELLRRRELASAQSAARADQDDVVARHLWEALRFEPLAPALARLRRGATLGRDARKRAIPPDATVIAVAAAAMMDERVVSKPRRFHGDRDPRAYDLHFGRGMHACWGEGIATAQMVGIAKALLRQDNLRRSPGEIGRLVLDGPFPIRLNVDFGPSRR